jgi:hypothetical protein
MGFYDVAFSSNASTFCLLQAVIPSYIHCSNVTLSHSPIGVSQTTTRWQEKTRYRIWSDGHADGK